VIVVSGAGQPAQRPVVTPELAETLSPEALWDLAADGADMPPALAAAIERAAERKAAPLLADLDEDDAQGSSSLDVPGLGWKAEIEPKKGTGDVGGGVSGLCNNQYYTQGYGDCPGDYDWQVCLDNWWNGAFAEHVDVRWINTNVCPETGTVVFAVDFDNGGDGAWSVAKDHVRWWTGSDWDCEWGFPDFDCPHFRADVLWASGDRFNFRVHALE